MSSILNKTFILEEILTILPFLQHPPMLGGMQEGNCTECRKFPVEGEISENHYSPLL